MIIPRLHFLGFCPDYIINNVSLNVLVLGISCLFAENVSIQKTLQGLIKSKMFAWNLWTMKGIYISKFRKPCRNNQVCCEISINSMFQEISLYIFSEKIEMVLGSVQDHTSIIETLFQNIFLKLMTVSKLAW